MKQFIDVRAGIMAAVCKDISGKRRPRNNMIVQQLFGHVSSSEFKIRSFKRKSEVLIIRKEYSITFFIKAFRFTCSVNTTLKSLCARTASERCELFHIELIIILLNIPAGWCSQTAAGRALLPAKWCIETAQMVRGLRA